MNPNRLPILTLILLLITAGCIFDSGEDDYRYGVVSIDSVAVLSVQERTVFFACYSEVSDYCWQVHRFLSNRQGNDIFITVEAKHQEGVQCATAFKTLESPVYFEVDAPGAYSFHFWQSDSSTVDTTFAIP